MEHRTARLTLLRRGGDPPTRRRSASRHRGAVQSYRAQDTQSRRAPIPGSRMHRDSLTRFPNLHACVSSLELSSRHDSGGTHGHHLGEPADPRTLPASASHAYERQSLQDLDLILAIDKTHPDNLCRIDLPGQQKNLQLLMDYSANFDDGGVPDACYGPGRTFELEIDMIEDAQGKAAQ